MFIIQVCNYNISEGVHKAKGVIVSQLSFEKGDVFWWVRWDKFKEKKRPLGIIAALPYRYYLAVFHFLKRGIRTYDIASNAPFLHRHNYT